jgi:hypothetical protein
VQQGFFGRSVQNVAHVSSTFATIIQGLLAAMLKFRLSDIVIYSQATGK